MIKRSKSLPLLLLLSLLPLGAGCLFGTPTAPPPPEPLPTYKPYYDADPVKAMDNLVHNFETAWELRDFAEYRDSILYSGTQEATDGALYPAFVFYYGVDPDPNAPPVPDYDLYERELQRVERMFGGLPGLDQNNVVVPGIKAISLDLTANSVWANPTNPDEVDGDPYPAGTKWRSYNTNMLITLKSEYINSINGWTVQDRLMFHLIPVRVVDPLAPSGYHTVYRLWKWRDIID